MKWFHQVVRHAQASASLAQTILRDRSLRRSLMFWGTLATLFAAFLGGFVLMDSLTQSPMAFAVYWLVVGFLVIFLLLLSLYDMLSVPRELRKESKLEDPDLPNANSDEPHD